MSNLKNKALLVSLSVKQWTGRKLDKNASQLVAQNYSAKSEAGNYTKKLLPSSRELTDISNHAQKIRAYFYENSLPWTTEGARIMSSKNYYSFLGEFSALKTKYTELVDSFLSSYESQKSEAALSLGQLYRESEYPSSTELKNLFDARLLISPLPDVSDFRLELGESEKNDWIESMKNAETSAMREAWSRLYEVINKATEKLNQPDAIFRDSLLTNITDLCAILPGLNIAESPELEQKRSEVESLVASLDSKKLRENAIERKNAANELASVLSSMSAFMGAES